jgi:hypothetical protein
MTTSLPYPDQTTSFLAVPKVESATTLRASAAGDSRSRLGEEGDSSGNRPSQIPERDYGAIQREEVLELQLLNPSQGTESDYGSERRCCILEITVGDRPLVLPVRKLRTRKVL